MRRWGRKTNFRVCFSIVAIIILIILTLIFFMIENKLKPTIKDIASSRANLIAVETINKTIYQTILGYTEYDDLINIHKDTENNITLIQANSLKISRLIAQSNLEIKKSMDELSGETFEIPIGQVLGSKLLASYGPRIKVKILPIGELDVQLLQDFYEAGINQTRHIIYLDIQMAIKIAIPMVTEKVLVDLKAPIAETIIVGRVPNTLVRLEGIDKLFKTSLYKEIEGFSN